MVEWIARVEMIRTTADGGGGWCGVVTGMGATPELALAELRREGKELGRRLVQEEAEAVETAEAAKAAERQAKDRTDYEARRIKVLEEEHRHLVPYEADLQAREREAAHRRKPRDEGPRLRRFEVVDVRLTPALEEGGRSGWLAYGTLARLGE
jgi:hypothetical protein